MRKKAFTLIELLVVITIIALLVSILMPALSRAKEQARIALCSSNLKQQGVAVMMYANANNGNVPDYGRVGNWMWDLSYETTRLLDKYAGFKNNEIYICPSNLEKGPDDRRWWQYWQFGSRDRNPEGINSMPFADEELIRLSDRQTEYYRCMPYLYFFYRPTFDHSTYSQLGGPGVGRQPEDWVRAGRDETWVGNMDRMKMAGEKPMIVDSVVSKNPPDPENTKFFDLSDGNDWFQTNSNHKSRKKNTQGLVPSGGNHCYVDGHVSWVSFNEYHPEQKPQVSVEAGYYGSPFFFFYWKYHHNYVGN